MVCHRKTHPPYRFGHGRMVSRRVATGAHPLAVGQRAQRAVPPQALLSTDETIPPQQMLTLFIQRWTVETTFEQARAHLGMETQRQWNDQAIARTTPLVLALFAMVAILADTLIKKTACSVRQTAWYRKTKPTFSDALAWIRKHIWLHFSTSTPHPDRQKPTFGIVERLIDIVCYAT